MTASEELERGYRRWLRWYPRAFRREYEAEMLGVLLAGAQAGQRRPGTMECADLLANALRLRLRPRPPSDVTIRTGLGALIVVGGLLELAAATTILATSDAVRAAVVERYPGFTDGEWQAVFTGQFIPHVLAACVAAAIWLSLGWAISRGFGWARIAIAIVAAVNGCSLVAGLAGGSAIVAGADAAVGVALCAVQLLAVVLMFEPKLAGLTRVVPRPGRPSDPGTSS